MLKVLYVSFILCLAWYNGLGQHSDTLSPPVLWQVKWNPAPVFRGDYEFGLEYQEKLQRGFEASAGITFRNSLLEGFQPRLFNTYYTATAERENRPGYSAKAAY